MKKTMDPLAEQIAAFRENYTGRRTVPWEMLTEAERLIRTSQAYHQRQAEAAEARAADRVAALEERHARELERAEQRLEQQRSRAERAEAAEQAYRKQQTNLRELRETVDDGVQVRISAPRVSTYGDRTFPRPWTLGELETIVYRLRAGGATDDTEVRFKSEHVEACIPFPEMVLEPRSRDDFAYTTADVEPQRPASRVATLRPDWRLTVGLVLVVVSIVVGAVIL